MKLKTEELRRFLSAAGQLKPNPTATNLDSIKIECTGQEVIFYKTNNNIWVKYSYVCQQQGAEVLLVNEKLLNGIALTSKEYEISLSPYRDGGNTIKIVSGEDVIETQNQDIKLFPHIQEATGERISISKECIERIRIAGKYVSTGANVTALNYVSIGLNGIFASNGSILYYHNTFPLPDVLLDQEPLNTIKGNDEMLYWQSDSYNFFASDGFTYGFIKTVVTPIAYEAIINQTGADCFVCRREDLIDFCTLVQYSKRQENPLATLQSHPVKPGTLVLNFLDADFNINVNRAVVMECSAPVQLFKFSVDWVATMLKTLPYELLVFTCVGSGHLLVTTKEDPDYKGIVARLSTE